MDADKSMDIHEKICRLWICFGLKFHALDNLRVDAKLVFFIKRHLYRPKSEGRDYSLRLKTADRSDYPVAQAFIINA